MLHCILENASSLWKRLIILRLSYGQEDRSWGTIYLSNSRLNTTAYVAALKYFLSLCTACRHFVLDFAYKAGALNKKFGKGEPRTSDSYKQKRHDGSATLQDELILVLELATPWSKGNFTLDTR